MSSESQRSSSGSGRSSKAKPTPQAQLSTIERSVTHLLALTNWSRKACSEGEVSDVYVRLGYEFNIACRAFNAIGVDTQDLGPVPDLLRAILEETLSQDASQASLDRFLPRIRDIIINLLHGLKKKQQRIRQRPPREGEPTSRSSTLDGVARTASSRSEVLSSEIDRADIGVPPRSSSVNGGGSSLSSRPTDGSRDNNVNLPRSDSDSSSISSNTMQNIPIIAPYPPDDSTPTPPQHGTPYGDQVAELPAPSPPPKQQEALLALQRGGDLERRASRRFSTFQIKQQLGAAANGMPIIPPAQNSPIPNRGREVRESMQAVRGRGSFLQGRKESPASRAPTEPQQRPQSIHQPRELQETIIDSESESRHPTLARAHSSTKQRKADDESRPSVQLEEPKSAEEPVLGATVSGPFLDTALPMSAANGEITPVDQTQTAAPTRGISRRAAKTSTPPPHTQQFAPEDSPQPGKPLTLFLQYKSRIKKIVLEEGSSDLTIARLQLAFIEKFSWHTHNNGDLPEIYVQDPVSGVRHELEDISDIKDRCVLALNVEALDEVKRHFDDGIGGLRAVVEGIKTSLDNQQSALDRVSDRQAETAKELASLSAAPPASRSSGPSPAASTISFRGTGTPKGDSLSEIQRLRRDLAIVRQTYATFVKDVEASMSAVRTKAASVKATAVKVSLPNLSGDTGRAYVTNGKQQLSDDSETIVKRVDSVLDNIEDLRKDVVLRGVRPLPRQLENVTKDISSATGELKRMKDFLKKEKPLWMKIWEQELANVCEERDMLTMNEELVVDLEGDLETASKTLELVEEATKQQMNEAKGARSTSGARVLGVAMDQAIDPQKAKDGMLSEVRALQPNHETSQNRLEAIERAEKARQRELESRREGEFKRELGQFVEEGRLKKTGGAEEAERLRKSKDDRIRREVWERMNGIAPAPAAEGEEQEDEEPLSPPAPLASSGSPALGTPTYDGDEWGEGDGNGGLLDVPPGSSERRDPSPPDTFVDAKEEPTATAA